MCSKQHICGGIQQYMHGAHKYSLWADCRVRTSQETHYVFATKPNRLRLFRETVAVYCENRTEHTNTLCGQTAESVPHRKQSLFIVGTIRNINTI
jgi:hypothetical protein